MTDELTERLDLAVGRLVNGEDCISILAESPDDAALRPLLEAAAVLTDLSTISRPASAATAADRQAFLFKVKRYGAISEPDPAAKAVSLASLVRLRSWTKERFVHVDVPQFIKERRPMFAFAFKLVLILGVAFGSMGGTAAMAANSLPGSAVYPVKLAIEQARLTWAQNPTREAELHLAFAQERVKEIEELAVQDRIPDEKVVTGLQEHLGLVVKLAAQLPDEAMFGLLQRTQAMIRAEQHGLTELQLRVNERARERLQQTHDALDQTIDEVELGLADPQLFRWRHTFNRPDEAPPQPDMTPSPPVRTPTGGNQNQFGSPADQPGPGGPGGNPDCPYCDPPADGQQQQQQQQHQQQQQQHQDQQQQQQQQNGGQQTFPPDQGLAPSGQGQHGGGANCATCEPAGSQSQHQNGQQSTGGQGGPGR